MLGSPVWRLASFCCIVRLMPTSLAHSFLQTINSWSVADKVLDTIPQQDIPRQHLEQWVPTLNLKWASVSWKHFAHLSEFVALRPLPRKLNILRDCSDIYIISTKCEITQLLVTIVCYTVLFLCWGYLMTTK